MSRLSRSCTLRDRRSSRRLPIVDFVCSEAVRTVAPRPRADGELKQHTEHRAAAIHERESRTRDAVALAGDARDNARRCSRRRHCRPTTRAGEERCRGIAGWTNEIDHIAYLGIASAAESVRAATHLRVHSLAVDSSAGDQRAIDGRQGRTARAIVLVELRDLGHERVVGIGIWRVSRASSARVHAPVSSELETGSARSSTTCDGPDRKQHWTGQPRASCVIVHLWRSSTLETIVLSGCPATVSGRSRRCATHQADAAVAVDVLLAAKHGPRALYERTGW